MKIIFRSDQLTNTINICLPIKLITSYKSLIHIVHTDVLGLLYPCA